MAGNGDRNNVLRAVESLLKNFDVFWLSRSQQVR